MIKEVKQYQAADGTCFTSKAEAEAYEEMLHNPHFKKIQDRIARLERDMLEIEAKIASLRSEPTRPMWPQGPIATLNHEAYNPATGVKNG